MNVKATDRCANCHCEFAEHNYVKDSIDKYACPYPLQGEISYGGFYGGDPRNFHPDYECCTPEEIARWKEACEKAEQLEADRNLPCPSFWIRTEHGHAHVNCQPFGIGTNVETIATFFEPAEHDYEDED